MTTKTIELSENDLEIILDALRKQIKQHKSTAERILKSDYSKYSTKEKSDQYLAKCAEIERIETELAYRFI